MGVTFSQFFPPKPTLTEANLPDQKGRVFIVTGGYSGVGLELCQILYNAGGKVYLAGRSKEKAENAILQIKASGTESSGDLVFLDLALDNLATIKPAVESFKSSESRLDVLFNNAGISNPPSGSVSAQGFDLQMATNCLGHHLLTQLLLPTLKATAKVSPLGSVRVVWTSSIVVDLAAPKIALNLQDLKEIPKDPQHNYTNSKIGNWFLASELASQVGAGKDGILSITQNPGNLKTALIRHLPSIVPILVSPLLYSARMGAYTELYGGLSDELKIDDGGCYIIPWGRKHPSPRPDLLKSLKPKELGGTSVAQEFVAWCDEKIRDYM
jgi:NAD(P)-dependent dehydrogenase (short-subunit alcohol dehydrogenase family)